MDKFLSGAKSLGPWAGFALAAFLAVGTWFKDDGALKARVDALEKSQAQNVQVREVQDIKDRLSRIENKLDRELAYHGR